VLDSVVLHTCLLKSFMFRNVFLTVQKLGYVLFNSNFCKNDQGWGVSGIVLQKWKSEVCAEDVTNFALCLEYSDRPDDKSSLIYLLLRIH
jgi:hypothetical protein